METEDSASVAGGASRSDADLDLQQLQISRLRGPVKISFQDSKSWS